LGGARRDTKNYKIWKLPEVAKIKKCSAVGRISIDVRELSIFTKQHRICRASHRRVKNMRIFDAVSPSFYCIVISDKIKAWIGVDIRENCIFLGGGFLSKMYSQTRNKMGGSIP
jgi:hypothetical protein